MISAVLFFFIHKCGQLLTFVEIWSVFGMKPGAAFNLFYHLEEVSQKSHETLNSELLETFTAARLNSSRLQSVPQSYTACKVIQLGACANTTAARSSARLQHAGEGSDERRKEGKTAPDISRTRKN